MRRRTRVVGPGLVAVVMMMSLPLGLGVGTGGATPPDGGPVVNAPTCMTPFSDVDGNHPFCEEIKFLASNDIAQGYPDYTFRPLVPVSRQAIAAWLYRLREGTPPVGPCDTTGGFTDVPASHPFCHEIMWMATAGYANGFPDGAFHTTAPVSRQALAAFLYRIRGIWRPETCEASPFPDVPVSHPFCQEIAWAADEGVANGYPDGTFHPDAVITRQAGAAFLQRFAGLPPT